MAAWAVDLSATVLEQMTDEELVETLLLSEDDMSITGDQIGALVRELTDRGESACGVLRDHAATAHGEFGGILVGVLGRIPGDDTTRALLDLACDPEGDDEVVRVALGYL